MLQSLDTGMEFGYVTALEAPADMRTQATQQLRESNMMIQQQSADYLRSNLYQNTQEGVEVKSAF